MSKTRSSLVKHYSNLKFLSHISNEPRVMSLMLLNIQLTTIAKLACNEGFVEKLTLTLPLFKPVHSKNGNSEKFLKRPHGVIVYDTIGNMKNINHIIYNLLPPPCVIILNRLPNSFYDCHQDASIRQIQDILSFPRFPHDKDNHFGNLP